jgi:hypothetical protein
VDRLLVREEAEVDAALEELRTEVNQFVEDGLRVSAERERPGSGF